MLSIQCVLYTAASSYSVQHIDHPIAHPFSCLKENQSGQLPSRGGLGELRAEGMSVLSTRFAFGFGVGATRPQRSICCKRRTHKRYSPFVFSVM